MISRDNDILHIVRYIHLNPVKHGLVEKPEDWPYSNYKEFIGMSRVSSFTDEFLKTQFNSSQEYKSFVEEFNPSESDNMITEHYPD